MFQTIIKLSGHVKRITGLAFSNTLKVLVSSGVDTQVSLACDMALTTCASEVPI